MSGVTIIDRANGVFRVVASFVYAECDRLPFNALRKVNAHIESAARGGLRATAEFNLRRPDEATAFVEWLVLFGDGGLLRQSASAGEDPSAAAGPPSAGEDDGELIPEAPPRPLAFSASESPPPSRS